MLRVFKHHIAFSTIILAVLESALLFAVLYALLRLTPGVALGVALGDQGVLPAEHGRAFYLIAPVTALGFVIMAAVGLYNREIFFDMRIVLSRAAISIAFIVVILLAVVYAYTASLTANYEYYYTVCLAGIVLHLVVVLLIRMIFLQLVNLDTFKRRVLVVGTGPLAAKIEALVGAGGHHFTTVGFVETAVGERDRAVRPGGVVAGEILDRTQALAQFVQSDNIDEIVVATRERRGLPVLELLECKLGGSQVTDFLSFWEREAQQIDLEELQPSWLIFSDGFRRSLLHRAVKRAFDVAVSGAFLAFTLPFTLAAWATVRLDSPGPAFYRQERVGHDGGRFQALKFRSMRIDAELDGVPRWAAAEDDRITRVGGLLRRARIDEIPQVLNVLKGDMSFVGPRPERPFFVEVLSQKIPFYDQRHRVKPGITGWAQINYPYGASEADARAKLAYDLYYVKNGGLFLDFVILVQTVRVILWPDGVR